MEQPLILTLLTDRLTHNIFTQLRTQYFPKSRNFLEAHITLFHHLPGKELTCINQYLSQTIPLMKSFDFWVNDVKWIGGGVIFKVESDHLLQVHKQLAHEFKHHLIPQDKQKFQPHYTVQNKTDRQTSIETYEQLKSSFSKIQGKGIGVTLYEYIGGPWRYIADYHFRE